MTTIEVLAGPVGEGGRNHGKDVKLVRRLLDDWRAREAGEAGDRPLPSDGPMEPRTRAAIRAFRAWSGLEPNCRLGRLGSPAEVTAEALAEAQEPLTGSRQYPTPASVTELFNASKRVSFMRYLIEPCLLIKIAYYLICDLNQTDKSDKVESIKG